VRYKDINPQKGDMFTVHNSKDYYSTSYGLTKYFDTNDSTVGIVVDIWDKGKPKGKGKQLSKRNKNRVVVYRLVGHKLKDNIRMNLGCFTYSVHSKKITYYPKKDV